MSTSTIIICAFLGIEGLISLITGKCFFFSAEKYTEDSLKKFARPHGLMTVITAALLYLSIYLLHLMGEGQVSGAITGASFIVLIIALVISCMMPKKYLVRK